MNRNLVATSSITIHAPIERVWLALTDPDLVRQYMFGTTIRSDWQPGSPITWSGEWKGNPYQDKGTIKRIERPTYLEYTHFSPLSGQPDTPENYHTVTVELSGEDGATSVRLSQDGNGSEEERVEATKTWDAMLDAMKLVVEGQ